MKYPRYKGEFVSITGDVWKAEIWQENKTAFPIIGDLTFDADCPIQIEWSEKGKEEVICGSTATIKVISPGDRTFADLYSVHPGRVRLDVYRNDNLYWSGLIDTEQYEEPYQMLKDYTVSITFSDFGILKRLKYNLSGMKTMADVLQNCLARSGMKYIMLDTHMISTLLSAADTQMRLNDITVRSENFYDEDGEASTLYDVIEGMMQPLAMRMIQKNGNIYVYDLNGMYNRAPTRPVAWSGDTQTMSVDKVYNNAKVTWSTYAQSGNMLPERAWGFIKTDANLTALDILEGKTKEGATYYTYHCNNDAQFWGDETDAGFTLWTAKDGMNAELGVTTGTAENLMLQYFKIVPQNDGSQCDGVGVMWPSFEYVPNANPGYYVREAAHGAGAGYMIGGNMYFSRLFKLKETWLPPVTHTAANSLLLRLSLQLLLDVRYNPYEEASKVAGNDVRVTVDHFNKTVNFVYVPVLVKFTENGTGKVWIWDNRAIVMRDIHTAITTMWGTLGGWVPYTEKNGSPEQWGYLAYYDAQDRAEKCGVLGWKENRAAINPHTELLTSLVEKSGNGQFIPYPNMTPNGGKITIEIMGGRWKMADGGVTLTEGPDEHVSEWDKVKWILCQLPRLEILNNGRYDKEINTDDVEYSATLNEDAEDGIDIDTICGTAKNGVPTARGAYFNTKTSAQITQLTRERRTTQAEELLIGTMYSQYAERHTKLSGVCELLKTDLYAYTEDNQPKKKFICVSEVEDVRMNESDAVFTELSRDEYKNQEGK